MADAEAVKVDTRGTRVNRRNPASERGQDISVEVAEDNWGSKRGTGFYSVYVADIRREEARDFRYGVFDHATENASDVI